VLRLRFYRIAIGYRIDTEVICNGVFNWRVNGLYLFGELAWPPSAKRQGQGAHRIRKGKGLLRPF
jgi:hypothetical protein